jgi:hypothetical protein
MVRERGTWYDIFRNYGTEGVYSFDSFLQLLERIPNLNGMRRGRGGWSMKDRVILERDVPSLTPYSSSFF